MAILQQSNRGKKRLGRSLLSKSCCTFSLCAHMAAPRRASVQKLSLPGFAIGRHKIYRHDYPGHGASQWNNAQGRAYRQKLTWDFSSNTRLFVPTSSSGGNQTDSRIDDRTPLPTSQFSARLRIRDTKPFDFLPPRQHSIIADRTSGDQGIASGS